MFSCKHFYFYIFSKCTWPTWSNWYTVSVGSNIIFNIYIQLFLLKTLSIPTRDGLRNFFKPSIFKSLSKILFLGFLCYTISMITCLYCHTTLFCLSGFCQGLKFGNWSKWVFFFFYRGFWITRVYWYSLWILRLKFHSDMIGITLIL